ncbi:MAG: hypothetical protein AAGI66_06935, partial [Cyanobacteria bacterium P01_H01_bin.74]
QKLPLRVSTGIAGGLAVRSSWPEGLRDVDALWVQEQEATGYLLLSLKGVQRKRDVSSGAKGSLGERATLSPDKIKDICFKRKSLP